MLTNGLYWESSVSLYQRNHSVVTRRAVFHLACYLLSLAVSGQPPKRHNVAEKVVLSVRPVLLG